MDIYKKEELEQDLMFKRALGELFEENTPFKTNSYVEESLLKIIKRWDVNVNIGEIDEYFRLLMLKYRRNPERFYNYEELMVSLNTIIKKRVELMSELVFQNEDEEYKIIEMKLDKEIEKEYN